MKLYTVVVNLDENPSNLSEAEYTADVLAALAQKVLELGVHDCQLKNTYEGNPMLVAYCQEIPNPEVH